jgi:hypothetical protein
MAENIFFRCVLFMRLVLAASCGAADEQTACSWCAASAAAPAAPAPSRAYCRRGFIVTVLVVVVVVVIVVFVVFLIFAFVVVVLHVFTTSGSLSTRLFDGALQDEPNEAICEGSVLGASDVSEADEGGGFGAGCLVGA